MTTDGLYAFAQILPVLYIATHFTLTGMRTLRACTALYAAIAELLLLLNIATGEEPETITTWVSFACMAAMLFTLAGSAYKQVQDEKPKNSN